MTREQFLSATAKGQGRAILALRSGQYTASLHDMRRLILCRPGYGDFMECSRGWYSVELMEASGMSGQLTEILVRHLARTKANESNASHRERVVCELALRGNTGAKEALYSHFSVNREFRLADEIIEVDGLSGLDWVISHSVGLLDPKLQWRYESWIDTLKETSGVEVVTEWLDRESGMRPEIREFAQVATAQRPPRDRSKQVSKSNTTYEEMLQEALLPGATRTFPVRWAAQANDVELARAWRAFVDEQDEEWLSRLGRALRRRPQFCDLGKAISRAREWDKEENPFVKAMEGMTDSRLRDLALELIAAGWIVDGVGLLERNAVAGDEQLVLSSIASLTDDWDLHSVGMDLNDIGKRLESSELLLWAYENNPCSFCREHVVRALIENQLAPEWLLRECLYDCVSDTRELAEGALLGMGGAI